LVVLHVIAIVVLCVTLSALAVGNGARFPNLRENSPSRIAAGFGGTLNLVESASLIIFVLLTIGIPGYWWANPDSLGLLSGWSARLGLGSLTTVLVGTALSIIVSAIAAVLAMRMGRRAFRDLQI
jgi:ABC-2 type transport system permease protein